MSKDKIEKKLKKNQKTAEKKGLDRHYYLEALGVDIEKCGTNFCDENDRRSSKWKKQREKYGFDERETWCLDLIFLEWLYEHLKMYKDKASQVIDLNFNTFEIGGIKYTLEGAIDEMTGILGEIIVKQINSNAFGDEDMGEIKKALDIFVAVFPALWW